MQEDKVLHSSKTRIHGFDVVRGFSVCSMVLFHFAYDLKYLAGFELSWFSGMVVFLWRASIAWTFLFLAGIMCSYSRDNLKRSFRYLGFALAIFVVTYAAAVDTPISFGIIFCIGASTLIDSLLSRANIAPKTFMSASLFLIFFYMTFHVSQGYLQFGQIHLALPDNLYQSGLLDWAGFLSPGFSSGDYYPLLPYFFMYAAGISFGRAMKEHSYPQWFLSLKCRPLEFVGRHSLALYVIHQPVLLAISYVAGMLLL